MTDWADETETRLFIEAGVNHLDSLKARLGGSIAASLRTARTDALNDAIKWLERMYSFNAAEAVRHLRDKQP